MAVVVERRVSWGVRCAECQLTQEGRADARRN